MRSLDKLEIQSVSGAASVPSLVGIIEESTIYYCVLGGGTLGAVVGGVAGVLTGGPSNAGAALGLELALYGGVVLAAIGALACVSRDSSMTCSEPLPWMAY